MYCILLVQYCTVYTVYTWYLLVVQYQTLTSLEDTEHLVELYARTLVRRE